MPKRKHTETEIESDKNTDCDRVSSRKCKKPSTDDETVEFCVSDVSFENSDIINETDDKNSPVADNSTVADHSTVADSEIIQNNKRKKYTSHEWIRETVFSSFEEAVMYLDKKKFVRFKSTESDRIGMKFYYRCKLVPKDRKIWCARQYMVHCPHDRVDAIVYHNNMNHNHDELMQSTNSTRKLSDSMIDYINSLFEMQTTKYSSIIQHLEKARKQQNLFLNESNPTVDQIAYRLKLFRSRETKPIVNLGELMGWCKDHSKVPDDPHTPFILDYWHEKNNGSGFKFGFVFTTLFLLNLFKSVDKVCIDSTYKLNWDGFPLTILGTTDRNKTFHPIAFACTTNETSDDYAFVFNAVKTKIKEFFSINFEPTTLISDAADAIRNAFYKIFPNATTDIMCFAHVLRNIEKRPFKSKNNKKLIKDDIMLMQQAPNKKSFTSMSKLFCAKWRPVEAEFVAYFKKQWLGVHCNWFEGAAVYTPSTNNAQEAVNGVIKRKVTLRKRLPMNQFMTSMMNLISSYSQELCNGSRSIAKEPFIESKMWQEGILLRQNSFTSFRLKPMPSHPKHHSYTVPSSKCREPTIHSYKTLANQVWKSFDEFIQHGFQQFYLVHLEASDQWKSESNCTCTCFMKHYMCKHVIALALKEELTEIPDEYDPTRLSTNKRGPGRSKNVQSALVIA